MPQVNHSLICMFVCAAFAVWSNFFSCVLTAFCSSVLNHDFHRGLFRYGNCSSTPTNVRKFSIFSSSVKRPLRRKADARHHFFFSALRTVKSSGTVSLTCPVFWTYNSSTARCLQVHNDSATHWVYDMLTTDKSSSLNEHSLPNSLEKFFLWSAWTVKLLTYVDNVDCVNNMWRYLHDEKQYIQTCYGHKREWTRNICSWMCHNSPGTPLWRSVVSCWCGLGRVYSDLHYVAWRGVASYVRDYNYFSPNVFERKTNHCCL